MHIPDGMPTGSTCAVMGAVLAGALGLAVWRVKQQLEQKAAPVVGVLAACIFAAQMVNFPVMFGTSGHLLGSVLAATILGPWGGMIVMTAVLVVQALVFADGGVTALGANVFNMAVIGSGLGYVIYDLVRRILRGPAGTVAAAVVASWFSVVLGAVACTVQLAVSGVYPFLPALEAMFLVHSLIGIGEAVITGLILAYVVRVRPDLLYRPGEAGLAAGVGRVVVAGFAVAVVVGVLLSPFASELPDGLEWTLERFGVNTEGLEPVLNTPFADYNFPWLQGLAWSTSVAGLIGVVVTFVAAYLIARAVSARLPAGATAEGEGR